MAEEHCVNVDHAMIDQNEIQHVVDHHHHPHQPQLILSESDTQWLLDLINQNNGDNPSQEIDFVYRLNLIILPHDLPRKIAANFIKSFSNDKIGKSLFQDFTTNTKDLLKLSYHDENGNKGLMIKSLFLSGCTILQFIHSYFLNELDELFGIHNAKARKIQEDLFRFDNQIPFRVIELLVNLTNNPNQLKKDIVKFIYINNITKDLPIPSSNNFLLKQWDDIIRIENHKHVHLLHILYLLITSSDGNIVSTNKKNEDNNILRCCSTISCSCFRRQRPNFNDPKGFFRNVEELKSTGIELKPTSSCLATISFNGKCFNLKGHLKLPPLIVDRWIKEKLHNLLLYEKFFKKHYMLISYVKFMDILIDREQDVRELRASRVLQNRLSSDADVADLFNRLGSRFSEPPHDFYSDVKTKIQNHCERKCAIWMTQVYQQYFSSPWTIIGLMAAAIVLSLTAVQTWFAVNPKD
ncbi:uncharacterized protein LOC115722055 [Cannabis sativa]|uniref:uncharacterized protein LOC115722055 n=1 Tax=Cannabis sativa TaxID=3483 RepID=UPI0029CA7C9E|nr:uncharacterized protein LOC115722055 [Cannabis sativa]